MRLQKFLADFVLRDSRLESHPKILATVVRVVSRDSTLDLLATVSKLPQPFGSRSLDPKGTISDHALDKREAVVYSDSRGAETHFLEVFCLSRKWKERSSVKITERTREKDTKALHRR